MKKIISVFLSVCILASLLSACSDSNKPIDFIYPFSGNIKSYDPQVASTADEFLIIENTFEGLIRIDDDSNVKSGAAESWDISSDGLKYTFHIKKGLKWNIDFEKNDEGEYKRNDSRRELMGEDFNPDITANDFVFALRRAAQPETNCPLFSSIACIKNAVAVHSGKMPANKLGVKAVDDYTLLITLSNADDSFMSTLSTAVAMPCNEEFFNATKGRYGLETKYTLFNGQFYVSQILETSYLLKKNEQYKGEHPAYASELTLKLTDSENDNDDTIDKLESGYYDAAFITGAESESIKKKSGITYQPYCDTTWAFLLNCNNEVFLSKTMREAFCKGFKRIEKSEKEYISNAVTLTPPSCTIGANNASKAIGKTAVSQDIQESIDLWKKGLELIDTKDITVNVITADYMQDTVKQMLQGIQSGIGNVLKSSSGETISFTIKVTSMNDAELKSSVAKGDYDIAFYPFKSSSPSAVSFLKEMSENNLTDFESDEFDKALAKAEKSSDLKSAAKYIRVSEKAAIGSYSICPMIYETSYYAAAAGVKNIQFHAGSGRVSFVNATRE